MDKKYYFWIVVGFILIMQIPLFSVFVYTPIIIQTVCQIGTFLYLRHNNAGADSMYRACFH